MDACECADSDLFYAKTGSDRSGCKGQHSGAKQQKGLTGKVLSRREKCEPIKMSTQLKAMPQAHRRRAPSSQARPTGATVGCLLSRVAPARPVSAPLGAAASALERRTADATWCARSAWADDARTTSAVERGQRSSASGKHAAARCRWAYT